MFYFPLLHDVPGPPQIRGTNLGRDAAAGNTPPSGSSGSDPPLAARDGGRPGGSGSAACALPPFTPHVCHHPWHTGLRAQLCGLFPRYGNYCGPNYSSGRSGGSATWDAPPVDWLDYCCFRHDAGYDSEDQADLLTADLAMVECLRSVNARQGGGLSPAGRAYLAMALFGLRMILIPYRKALVRRRQVALDLAQGGNPSSERRPRG